MKTFPARLLRSCCIGFVIFVVTNAAGWAQLKTLVNFNSPVNGGYPRYMSLVQGTDGNLYGTTLGLAYGSIFKMTPSGVLTTIYSFTYQNGGYPNGAFPDSGLVLGKNGNFYGTTVEG